MPRDVVGLVVREDLVLLGDAAADARTCDDGRGFCHLPAHPPRNWRRGAQVTAADLLAAIRAQGLAALADLVPPYSVVAQTAPGAPVWVATDANGLQHVYACRDRGNVLVSDSCLLLAALADAPLDVDAVLTCLRIGHHLGADSPFRGVGKLLGGEAWQLAAGEHTTVPVPAAQPPDLDGAACLRECVRAQLDPDDDSVVELSGGLDSRLITAALGADACRGRRAVTLGTADAADVRIAGDLARELGFQWQFVDLHGMARVPDAELLALVHRASLRCDHTTQPLARAVLEWVNDQTPRLPRFSGQNGELARGFFYPGFADSPQVTPGQVARMLHWRLSTNDSIDRALVADDVWRSHEQRLLLRLHDMLAGYGKPWLQATDEFYLRERMQRWVGVAYSAETQHHGLRAPFFDPRFIAWARRLPPAQKRGSLAMARLIGELLPALARVPMAAGLSPQQQGSSSPVARLRRRAQFLHKVVRKVGQRVIGARRSPVGAPELARRLLASGAGDPAALPRVATLDWIRGAAIGDVLGRGVAGWASLGHLLALEWTLAALDRARRARG
ncbi:MAG: asparagine synthase [Planctomycetes bacterium]|nr:asparagine synthase [Planctomycetota bacterium]